MTPVPYWHVDAFADRPFTGNQAAVMTLADWPVDAVLQAIGVLAIRRIVAIDV